MGASPYKVLRYTGTPKTFDNTIHLLWEDCSQAHWMIPCLCGKICRSTVESDLLEMIGDLSERPDGSKRTLICPKCGRDLNSRMGWWEHTYPEKQLTFPGYHVPQPILPMHYEYPKEWQVLLETRRDKPQYIFYNECLGESFDSGAKLITAEEIRQAAVVPPCEPHNLIRSQYVSTALGVDWGGRGKERSSDTEDFISNTAMALACLRTDGVIEVPWVHKVPYAIDQSHEAKMAANVAGQAQCDWLSLDYGGQGNVQESQVRGHGWPERRICPFTYSVMSPTKPIVFFNPPQASGARSSYTLDKPRSLLLLCELVKRGLVLLPNSDKYLSDHLRDFLSIYCEEIENPRGSPTRLVKRLSRRHDDVVHAINFAVMCLYHSAQVWPALAQAFIQT